MENIFTFMENQEECQFSINNLIVQIEGVPEKKTIIKHLVERYGNKVIVSNNTKETIICYKNTGHTILTDSWYAQKRSTETEEQTRIIETAADILYEAIRSKVYDLDTYPPPDTFLSEIEDLVFYYQCASSV